MAEIIACNCDGLPPHDHFVGLSSVNGVYGYPIYDLEDIGRVWINWKALAKELLKNA